MSGPAVKSFDRHISHEEAYRLICLFNGDVGGQDAISARGWLKYSSFYVYDAPMTLMDGSRIYRDFVTYELYHTNGSVAEVYEALGLTSLLTREIPMSGDRS